MPLSFLPILTYHSLDDSGSIVSTAPSLFTWQMEFLHRNGFHTVSLSHVAGWIDGGAPLPDKAFVISFDDGYENIYTEAFPTLQAYGFTATVFLVTDYCGKLNNWPGHVSPIGDQHLLCWAHALEMSRHGIELGSHTMTHPDLRTVSLETVEQEMRCSKATIEDHVGKPVPSFAYPYGRYSDSVKDIAKRHFAAACSSRLGNVSPDSDLHTLPRIDMYFLSRKFFVGLLTSRPLDFYLSIRHALRTVKDRFI
jgi:peptidoglycan/xylan/chitin deacetylase (PgdA/CDA1 family)